MNQKPDPAWTPDPQLLAAYFDGELEGRDDVADMRARIESWIGDHPEAGDAWMKHHQMQMLWEETTPREPSAAAWERTLEAIDARRRVPMTRPGRGWIVAGMVAASIVAGVGLTFGALRSYWTTPALPDPIVQSPQRLPDTEEEGEDLIVANADEIVVLRIEDADSRGVVVGTFPVSGPMEFADSGEVCISCKCPRVMVRQDPPHRPMVSGLARADTE